MGVYSIRYHRVFALSSGDLNGVFFLTYCYANQWRPAETVDAYNIFQINSDIFLQTHLIKSPSAHRHRAPRHRAPRRRHRIAPINAQCAPDSVNSTRPSHSDIDAYRARSRPPKVQRYPDLHPPHHYRRQHCRSLVETSSQWWPHRRA